MSQEHKTITVWLLYAFEFIKAICILFINLQVIDLEDHGFETILKWHTQAEISIRFEKENPTINTLRRVFCFNFHENLAYDYLITIKNCNTEQT